jgi:hypothetical protein
MTLPKSLMTPFAGCLNSVDTATHLVSWRGRDVTRTIAHVTETATLQQRLERRHMANNAARQRLPRSTVVARSDDGAPSGVNIEKNGNTELPGDAGMAE